MGNSFRSRWLAESALLTAAIGCGAGVGDEGGPCDLDGRCEYGSVCVFEICESLTSNGGLDTYELVSPGTFTMGSPASELGRRDGEEQRQERVTRAFYMNTTEVTQQEWRSVTGYGNAAFWMCGAACPIQEINWWEGVAYLNKLSERAGLSPCYNTSGCQGTLGTEDYGCANVTFAGLECDGYRYPTEVEWEYAARAGTTTAFYTGDITHETGSDPALEDAAWHIENSDGSMHPVGRLKPNAFGLYDMLGNVGEWVHDRYEDDIDSRGRYVRGGSWDDPPRGCRAAIRSAWTPEWQFSDVGLRPVRSAL